MINHDYRDSGSPKACVSVEYASTSPAPTRLCWGYMLTSLLSFLIAKVGKPQGADVGQDEELISPEQSTQPDNPVQKRYETVCSPQ